jgi:hypothetical protein
VCDVVAMSPVVSTTSMTTTNTGVSLLVNIDGDDVASIAGVSDVHSRVVFL